jgi:lipid-A-disaccharide synthase-like uncharacterized protein
MSRDPLLWLGLVGQALFAGRMLLQWIASERAGESVVPRWFWHLSLLASACVGTYAALAGNLVFLLTVLPGAFIYARMLALERRSGVVWLAVLAAPIAGLALWAALRKPLGGPPLVAAAGFAGWLVWMARFPIQWWISERRGVATLDAVFWAFSLVGGTLLLGYALWHRDWVMVLAFGPGPLFYVRNLVLLRRARQRTGAPAPAPSEPAFAFDVTAPGPAAGGESVAGRLGE